MTRPVSTAEAAMLRRYGRYLVDSHTPQPQGALSCDETGCWICNHGDPELYVLAVRGNPDSWPGPDELAEAEEFFEVAARIWPSAERQLCAELLTAWAAYGSDSDEFLSLIRQAVIEFDAQAIVYTLLAISQALLLHLAEVVGDEAARSLIQPITNPAEVPAP